MRSNVVILLEDIPGILNEHFFGRVQDVLFEVVEGDVVAGRFIDPLEVEPEIVGNVFLNVEFVDGEAVCHEHGPLRQL